MKLVHFTFGALIAGLAASAAFAQSEKKADIFISNFRADAVSVRYDYVISTYAWNLMTRDLQPGNDLTYRRPADLPGCKQLMQLGIDKGKFTISAKGAELCTGPLSICDQSNYRIEVHDGGCRSRVTN